MKKIDLSFGIPMYNAEEYILELLDCFKETKDFTYEIILIDDGSKDNSYEICKKYNNKNIKLFKQKNMGVSETRNRIIELSTAKWITFIDSDDLIDFDNYSKIFKKIKNKKYDYCIDVRNNALLKKIEKYSDNRKISYLIEKEIINSPWAKFYKTDILKNNNIHFDKEISLGEDLLFNLNYYKHCKDIYYFYGDMYKFRYVNTNSLTHKYTKNKFEILMNVNNMCNSLFNDDIIKKSLEFIRIKNCLSCYLDIYKFKQEINNPKEYKKEIKKYKKRKYLLLNNFFTTLIYNAWYILPDYMITFFVKIILLYNK